MHNTNTGFITLSNNLAECKISLWGGNLISYRPKNETHDVFWLGELNKFDNIQAIRGGIPVCWPRFAEESLNNHLPRHGFARLSTWNLNSVQVNDDLIQVELSLPPNDEYTINAEVTLSLKITDKLEYSLKTTNLSNDLLEFSEALHAYFNISSLENVEIEGLSQHKYKNSLNGNFYTLEQNLKIAGEYDSIFMNHTQPIKIKDKGFNRTISLEKTGSYTTVVWNPNKDLAEMSAGQYKHFVCVEPSNVGNYAIKLQPHATHTISAIIQVQNLG